MFVFPFHYVFSSTCGLYCFPLHFLMIVMTPGFSPFFYHFERHNRAFLATRFFGYDLFIFLCWKEMLVLLWIHPRMRRPPFFLAYISSCAFWDEHYSFYECGRYSFFFRPPPRFLPVPRVAPFVFPITCSRLKLFFPSWMFRYPFELPRSPPPPPSAPPLRSFSD